jgi:hypothetical protein
MTEHVTNATAPVTHPNKRTHKHTHTHVCIYVRLGVHIHVYTYNDRPKDMSRTPPRRQSKTVTDPGRQSQLDSARGEGGGEWRGGGGEVEGTLLDVYTHAPAKKEVGLPGEREHDWGRDVGCAGTGGGRQDGEGGSGGRETEAAVCSVHVDTLEETETVSGESGHDVGRARGLKPTRIVHNATPFAWGLPVARVCVVCDVCGVCVTVCKHVYVCERAGAHMHMCVRPCARGLSLPLSSSLFLCSIQL